MVCQLPVSLYCQPAPLGHSHKLAKDENIRMSRHNVRMLENFTPIYSDMCEIFFSRELVFKDIECYEPKLRTR